MTKLVRAIGVRLLFIIAYCLAPGVSSPSPEAVYNPVTPVLPTLFDHRWPSENPLFSTEFGCGYVQPTVSAVLGEFRPSGGGHYHGGVDVAIGAGDPVYSVLQDFVFVDLVDYNNHEVGIRVRWTTGEKTYYRYLHVDPYVGFWDTLKVNDEIVWNPSALGRYYDSLSGRWKWPVQLPICRVANITGIPQHLHYEENWWHPSNGSWIRYNPLLWLCPWTDTSGARIEDVAAYTGSGTRITTGQGTESNPWIVTSDFDLRVHAYDTLPNRLSNKAGLWNAGVDVRDPYGINPLPTDPVLGPWFSFLPRQASQYENVVNTGFSYVYDASVSSQSDYYYWATNSYDEVNGGIDWEIKTLYLTPYTKYKITVSATDWDWNWADDTVWVVYDDGSCTCPSYQGDLNLDGVANTIADAVTYSNYFIGGIGAFETDPNLQILASDVNDDGVVLTVADLVYLIRIITGYAQPCPLCGNPKMSPSSGQANAIVSVGADRVTVTANSSVDLGGAVLTFRYSGLTVGDAALSSAASQMAVMTKADRGEARVLVVPSMSVRGARINAGVSEILSLPISGEGTIELVSVEMSDASGALLSATSAKTNPLPQSYALLQNYPNPFNAGTVISFNLKDASDWTLQVYNITGQTVRTFSGNNGAGQVHVSWDATDGRDQPVPTGVYFYSLRTRDGLLSRKMVVLK